MSPSDTRLLQRWIDTRDADAFNELVSRHASMVYSVCKRVVRSSTDAEDVAQECFLRLTRARRAPKSSFTGWLHAMAVHLAIDHVRRTARRARFERRFAIANARSRQARWSDLEPYVDEAIADLPALLRDVIVAHYLDRESHARIAARLGISRQAVSARARKGVERIREALRRRGALEVSAGLLSSLLASRMLDAAPRTLVASLGRLAVAGPSASVGPCAKSTGVFLMAKKASAFVAVAALLVGLLVVVSVPPWSRIGSPPSPPLPAPLVVGTERAGAFPPPPEAKIDDAVVPPPRLRVLVVGESRERIPGAQLALAWGPAPVSGNGTPAAVRPTRVIEPGPDGTFLCGEWQEAEVELSAVAPGFLLAKATQRRPVGGNAQPITIVLHRGPTFVGRVVDVHRADAPVSGARVGVENPFHHRRTTTPTGSFHEIESGTDGRFHLTGMNAVRLTCPEFWVVKDGYSPTSVRLRESETFAIEEEQRIPLYPPTALHVVVRFADGQPVSGFEYGLRDHRGQPRDAIEWQAAVGSAAEIPLYVRYQGGADRGFVQGYVHVRNGDAEAMQQFALEGGEREERVVTLGSAGSAVVGRLLDEQGTPVAGALVATTERNNVLTIGRPGQVTHEPPTRTAQTDADGHFAIATEPGEVWVVALHREHPVYSSDMVWVPDGAQVRHDIRFPRAATVCGRVIGGAGRSELTLQSMSFFAFSTPLRIFRREEWTDEEGFFCLESVSPGIYHLSSDTSSDTLVTVLPGQTYDVVLPPVRRPHGLTVSGTLLAHRRPAAGKHVFIQPLSGSDDGNRGVTDVRGAFRIEGLPPGRHTLGVYLGTLRDGQPTYLREAVDVSPDMRPLEVDISVRTVEGVVRCDAGPLADAAVSLRIPEFRDQTWRWSEAWTARTDAAGAYRLVGIPGSRYLVVVAKEGFTTALVSADAAPIARIQRHDVHLERTTAGGTVRFAAADSRDGRPVPASVTVYSRAEPGPICLGRYDTVEPDVSLELTGLPDGTYLAVVESFWRAPYARKLVTFEQEAGVETDLDVELEPGASIVLRAYAEDGVAPEASVAVFATDGSALPIGPAGEPTLWFRGGFRLPCLPLGRLELHVSPRGRPPLVVPVSIDGADEKHVEVRLPHRY